MQRPTIEQLKELRKFANELELQYVDAAIAHKNNYGRAAASLGKARSSLRDSINKLAGTAAKHGFAPEQGLTHPTPPGFEVKKTSTLYDADGEIRLQWQIINQEVEGAKKALAAFAEAASESLKREKPIPPPKGVIGDLLNLYVITDYHIGMRSWPDETGDDWDTDIAEDMLYRWFASAIKAAPKAHTAIFGQIGDFLHYDGLEAVTPASRHVLDADTRYQKLVRVAIRAIRRIVRELLKNHEHVHLIMADANHDESGSAWLRELLHALYDEEPRVTVDRSADTYYCYEWGLTSLFFHHGHKRKPELVDTVFAQKFREVFGRTKHAYGHMGHYHHEKTLETNLMIVRQHRTLAAKDAYASRAGYLSGRSADVVTYHKEYGEVGRISLSPEMI